MYVGLDIGGTFLKAGRIDETGRVSARLRERVDKGSPEAILRQLEIAVRSLAEGSPSVRAVGIGIPGFVDRRDGSARGVPNVPALEGLRLAEEMERRTDHRTFLENDANAAALAEAWLGAGRGAESMLLLTLGTGIGAGLILGGRAWGGRSGYAGEIGHIQVEADGAPCGCGSRGCLETVAGTEGWTRRAKEALARRDSVLRGTDLRPPAIVEAAKGGDPVALELVDGAARALGVAIAAVLDLLNLDRVVIGGGLSAAGSLLLGRIREETRRRTFPQIFADCSFLPASLGDDAGVVGAARAAMVALEG